MIRTQPHSPASLLPLLGRYWGYESYLPDQEEAIQAVLDRRDSLVVMPTGGGKSVVFQLPAVAGEGVALVVSPLIALMEDQVRALAAMGIPAAALNHAKTGDERRAIARDVREGRLKLVYVSPEALQPRGDRDSTYLLDLLGDATLRFVAIDEAHCISQWGHDFWPSYRQLGTLRDRFPGVPIHAFTATATERVRGDIVASLRLQDPFVLVGDFDRPNLTYRILPRRDTFADVCELLARHAGEAGIIYCGTRDEVDQLGARLAEKGHRALGYHAGLTPELRKERQDSFMAGEADIMVATVAFGMGIDRPDIRFVAHAAMPPCVENYSQEAGRAGRDRLPAECVLLFSAQDLMMWKRRKGEPRTAFDHEDHARLQEMFRFAASLTCRHRFLVQYFGQPFDAPSCGACDVCLGEREAMPDSARMAKLLLEGVRQVRFFGGAHVADVLRGVANAKVKERSHDQLPCYGSLRGHDLRDIRSWLDQLLAQGFLAQGDHAVLRLTDAGRDLLEDRGMVRLSQPPRTKAGKPRTTAAALQLTAQEEALFSELRTWRLQEAKQRNWPAYVVFADTTLIEIARARPTSLPALSRLKGVGEAKLAEFGESVLAFLAEALPRLGLTSGASQAPVPSRPAPPAGQLAPGMVRPTAPGPGGPPLPGPGRPLSPHSGPASSPTPPSGPASSATPPSGPASSATPPSGPASLATPPSEPASSATPPSGPASLATPPSEPASSRPPPAKGDIPVSAETARARLSPEGLTQTVQASLDLFRAGQAPEEIAALRALTVETVYSHLGTAVDKCLLAADDVVPAACWAPVEEAVAILGGDQPLGALRALVPMSVPYGILKIVLDTWKRRGLPLAARDPEVVASLQWLVDLGATPDSEAAGDLADRFDDADHRVRSLALNAYGAIEGAPLEPVLAVLDRDPVPVVRQSALRTLARRGGPDLVPILERIAADLGEDAGTRTAATAAIARLRKAARSGAS
ncbi:MAG: RecQ family ATP-dependent DNA helicase [Candidatus Sericytochromatia bacterium]|nr:RecQ family ATP-dependent DNA helicase [Candidatus Tanganyikabacteria bacterium]